eukprot:440975-Karenia_brevis.AAC.1
MTTTPPSFGPGPVIEGDQHGSGAGRLDSLGMSSAGARGEADLYGGADLTQATAAATFDIAQQVPINEEDADLASGVSDGKQSSGTIEQNLINNLIA